MEIYELTVHELLEKLEKKEITSQEIVESYLICAQKVKKQHVVQKC